VRILGIDPGEVRVGIAISDPRGIVAVPVGVFSRSTDGSAAALARLAKSEGVELIVMGLPLLSGGEVGTQARKARRFGREIETLSGLAVVFWDERFSSQDAGRILIASGAPRKRRRYDRDATAAAIILQDYLDRHPQKSCQPA
jgi:putative Holliday junction resolvase